MDFKLLYFLSFVRSLFFDVVLEIFLMNRVVEYIVMKKL